MRSKVFGVLCLVVSIAELIACFIGPMAFVRKPTLAVFPIFSIGLDDKQTREVTSFLEKAFASTNSFAIISQIAMADYVRKADPDSTLPTLKPVNFDEAYRIAREMGLERFVTAVAFESSLSSDLSVTIFDMRSGESVKTVAFSSDTMDNLMRGIGNGGVKLPIKESLSIPPRGIGFAEWIALALFACQAAMGILALLGREPAVLPEVLFVPAFILFLFSYIYAINANMDYMQRFIASGGEIRLAQSTALERLYAGIRFGPFVLLNGIRFICRTLSKPKFLPNFIHNSLNCKELERFQRAKCRHVKTCECSEKA
jgi:hypothetical protein